MSSVENLIKGQPEGRKAKPFAGFKGQLRFSSPDGVVNTEVRYAKADIDPVFKPESIKKVGPNNGEIRFQRGEWKTFEKQPDGSEIEIPQDSIRYVQSVEGAEMEVEPFDSTKVWDIREERPLDECALDGETALGTLIPREQVDEFGPDKEAGSSLYEI